MAIDNLSAHFCGYSEILGQHHRSFCNFCWSVGESKKIDMLVDKHPFLSQLLWLEQGTLWVFICRRLLLKKTVPFFQSTYGGVPPESSVSIGFSMKSTIQLLRYPMETPYVDCQLFVADLIWWETWTENIQKHTIHTLPGEFSTTHGCSISIWYMGLLVPVFLDIAFNICHHWSCTTKSHGSWTRSHSGPAAMMFPI